MPKKLEEIRKAVQRSGKSKDQAYAIATAQYKKLVAKSRSVRDKRLHTGRSR